MPCLCDGRQVRQNDVSKPYATWLSEARVAEVLAAKAVETRYPLKTCVRKDQVAEVLAAKAVETPFGRREVRHMQGSQRY